jgi:2-polyprenyl-6-methoxyphenol hydroxylase-like FAD-dependent oxidoreductase
MIAANHFDTDVLIVGAGPTGLALASTLSRAGIRPIIVEKLAAHQNTSRAAVIHAHTLEQLDGLGLAEPMLRDGLRLTRFSVRDRDQVLARLNFDWLPSRFACLLMLPQDRTEAILTNALEQTKTAVRWGCSLEGLTVTDDGVEAIVSSAAGTQTLRARYVVGADGMHSRVRQAAGIGFSGHSYEQSFILADVEMEWKPGRDEVMLFFSPEGLLVVAPLPGNAYRVVATVDEAPATPEASDVEQLLRRRGPSSSSASVHVVRWSSRFRLHHRVADRYRHGRLLLVGDAAHVHSPAGGQGMNTGLVDACVLGKLLTRALFQRTREDPLDRYESMRRPAAKEVLALAGRLTAMAILKGRTQRLLRNVAFRLVGALPPLRRRLEMSLSGLSRRAAAELPAPDSSVARGAPCEATP